MNIQVGDTVIFSDHNFKNLGIKAIVSDVFDDFNYSNKKKFKAIFVCDLKGNNISFYNNSYSIMFHEHMFKHTRVLLCEKTIIK
jgi:hypothetical protein